MSTNGIESLSEEDLYYLEKMLAEKFSQECEYAKNFQTKNSWSSNEKTARTLRLMNAVRSTKNSLKIKRQRW